MRLPSLCWAVLLSLYPLNRAVSQQPYGVDRASNADRLGIPFQCSLHDSHNRKHLEVWLPAVGFDIRSVPIASRGRPVYDFKKCIRETHDLGGVRGRWRINDNSDGKSGFSRIPIHQRCPVQFHSHWSRYSKDTGADAWIANIPGKIDHLTLSPALQMQRHLVGPLLWKISAVRNRFLGQDYRLFARPLRRASPGKHELVLRCADFTPVIVVQTAAIREMNSAVGGKGNAFFGSDESNDSAGRLLLGPCKAMLGSQGREEKDELYARIDFAETTFTSYRNGRVYLEAVTVYVSRDRKRWVRWVGQRPILALP